MSKIQTVQSGPNEELYESPKLKNLKKTCHDFEAVMVSLVLKEGLKGAKELNEGADEEDSGTKAFKDFAYEQMSYCVGQSGMIGLGDKIFESMKDRVAAQEQANEKPEAANSLLKTPNGRVVK